MQIWAEAGACEGDIEYAKKAAQAVADAGAQALKVQWLTNDRIFSKDARRYDYTGGDWKDQSGGYPKTIPPGKQWLPVIEICDRENIKFIPAVFDLDAAIQARALGLRHVKIASGDITNEQLIKGASDLDFEEVTLSTGAATMDEVERAVTWLRGSSVAVKINLLACHLQYPTPLEDANLGRIFALRDKFKDTLQIGYSDHTRGAESIPLAAVCGAQIIEKHFTLQPGVGGGDHDFAVDPDELKMVVELVQYTYASIGNAEMAPTVGEQPALEGARRGLYASRDLKAGTRLTPEDVIPLRPHAPNVLRADEYTATVGALPGVGGEFLMVDVAKGEPLLRASVGGAGATLSVT